MKGFRKGFQNNLNIQDPVSIRHDILITIVGKAGMEEQPKI